jgi:quinol monooxygenase YgiN
MVYVITVHLHANDHPDSVDKIKAKLIEASRVYSKDKETLSWFVSQSTSDPRDFTIIERYEKESVSKTYIMGRAPREREREREKIKNR